MIGDAEGSSGQGRAWDVGRRMPVRPVMGRESVLMRPVEGQLGRVFSMHRSLGVRYEPVGKSLEIRSPSDAEASEGGGRERVFLWIFFFAFLFVSAIYGAS